MSTHTAAPAALRQRTMDSHPGCARLEASWQNVFLDKGLCFLFNVDMTRLFVSFYDFFFFRSLHPGITLP
jgi:hypothetical protein